MKVTFEGTVVRVYEETRGQRTNKYIVVSDKAEKYPDIFRFSLKQGSAISVAEGCQVKVTAYLHGREWANSEGKLVYFTDLNVDTVEVLNNPAAATATPAAKPTTATNWAELLDLGSAYGEDRNAVTNRCKATHPGKASDAYAAADWQAVANVIVAAHTPPSPAAPAPDFTSDMPF